MMFKQGFHKNIEILAPAGDFESVKAAVLNGANAIYLGEKSFSARQNAKNFSDEELLLTVSYCHARDVLVYLTLNTLIFDFQRKSMEETIIKACNAGVDALIIQDLGVFSLAKAICPDMAFHASTQMSITSLDGAKLLAKMGFSRVVLARELSFEQISEITKADIIETEVFVHGALCMSVSGQCYISGMLMERSGNRGSCAGICRLPFAATPNEPTKGSAGESYDLSLKDLCLVDECKRLESIGVTSLKIEGRMKRPEYVAAATSAYSSSLLDLPYDLDGLKAVFSRSGFTDGYFNVGDPKDMFGYRLKEDVTATTSSLLKGYANTYHKEKGIISLSLKLIAKENQPVKLIGIDKDKNQAEAVGDIPQKAINRETTKEDIIKSLEKLGGTIFVSGKTEAEIDPGLMLPMSQINELRRNVTEQIFEKRSAIKPVLTHDIPSAPKKAKEKSKESGLIARYQSYSQLDKGESHNLSFFSLPTKEVLAHSAELLQYKQKLMIEPPRGLFTKKDEDTERENLTKLKALGFFKLVANNLGHIELGGSLGYELYGGVFLNCTNSMAINELSALKIKLQTISFETPLIDGARLISDIPTSAICYGYLPLMLLKTCPMKNKLDCTTCRGKGTLTDRMGKSFRLLCNDKKYTELLNTNPLYLAERMNEFSDFEYKLFYFTIEEKDDCNRIFEYYRKQTPPAGEFTRGLYYRKV